VRHVASSLFLASLLPVLSLAACGSDEGKRGLTPPDEVAAPNSPAEDEKTEAQRDAENLQQEERNEDREFDAGEGGN
jgi:predicted small lipoprotein YifL